jgi:DNA replication protein DnaC
MEQQRERIGTHVPDKGRIKTLEEILRANPEAVAYWRDLKARPKADAVPDFDAPQTCPTCGGLGWVIPDVPNSHPLFGKGVPCPNPDCKTTAERREERYAKLCTLSQIPAEYQRDEVSFAGWQELEQIPALIEGKRGALGAALAFIASRERGFKFTLDDAAALGGIPEPEFASNARCSLVLTGRNGVGKTSLAVSIAKLLLEDGVPVVYLRFADFFDGLKERFKGKASYEFGGDEADDEAAYLRQYQQAPVLVLDEFGADVTDWRRERAEALINYRYTNQLPTIFTTNLDEKQLLHLWGLTLGSRIQAMAHWVLVDGVELRERAKVWVTP